jgi:hypothetical protein
MERKAKKNDCTIEENRDANKKGQERKEKQILACDVG